jgi:hypothetical protein
MFVSLCLKVLNSHTSHNFIHVNLKTGSHWVAFVVVLKHFCVLLNM